MFLMFRIVWLFFALAFPSFYGSAASEGPEPVLLTLEVSDGSGDTPAVFELRLRDLEAYPPVEFETNTIWTSGLQKFKGVRLHILLQDFGANSGTLMLQAINDYQIFIPVEEITPDGAIIAYALNDRPMSRRGKGPLWLVYDYDASAEFRTETVYSYSIWQLDRIAVLR